MEKEEFLEELRNRLNGLPQKDIDERVSFYSEMIDDRVEDGMTEEEAINNIGGIDEVVKQIASETPISSLVKERVKPKNDLGPVVIALLILGFPLWFPLLIVGLVLILVSIILIFVLVIVTFSVEAAFIGSAGMTFVAFLVKLIDGGFNSGYLAISITLFGISLMFLPVCFLSLKATWLLFKTIILGVKRKLIGGKKAR